MNIRKLGDSRLCSNAASGLEFDVATSDTAHMDDGLRMGDVRIDANVNATVRQAIGSQLRVVYHEVVRQPVPDRWLALLGQMEQG